jgi:microcystin degradation protein MlrC
MHERGYKTAELVARAIRCEIHPVQWVATPPLVVNVTKHFTDVEPMLSVVRDCAAASSERAVILDTSVALGSPYVDAPHMGMSFIAIADHADLTAAQEAARWMATRAWHHRAALCLPGPARAYGTAAVGNKATSTAGAPSRPSVSPAPVAPAAPELTCDGAVRAADRQFVGRKLPRQREGNSAAADGDGGRAPLGPIVIMDVGDNISGGAPGDSTHLLRAALRQRVDGFLQTLVDPAAVAACLAAGVGGSVRGLAVGGKVDSLHGEPVEVAGVVTAVSDGEWEDPGPVHGGPRRFSAGACASVLVARGKVTLVLTSKRCPNVSLGVFTHLGIAPEAFRVIVAKGVESPRLAFEPIAAALLTANTPGITSVDMTTFAFQRRRVPLYPFEKNAQLPWPRLHNVSSEL